MRGRLGMQVERVAEVIGELGGKGCCEWVSCETEKKKSCGARVH